MDLASPQAHNRVQSVILQQHLSKRGAYNSIHRDIWGPREKSMANPWSPSNPDGTVILRLAENSLLHQEVADFLKQNIEVRPLEHLTYSTGPRGSLRLRRVLANFLTEHFHTKNKITADNLFITPGLASGLDAVAWSICDEGEGILIPQPFYNGFSFDLLNRANARVIGVSYKETEGYRDLDDLFDPDVNKRALETALHKAEDSGIRVRALLVSNPHNPLGRCYSPETLHEFATFCSRHQIHLISDEIYAKSVFPNPAIPGQQSFVSILSLDLHDIIDPALVHVLYGASKDFCANGLRIGAVCTGNESLIGALSSISMFSWSPHVLQDVWASMLEDRSWLESFQTKKATLMLENYSTATTIFRKHNISYYEMNAGLFIWIDLRRLFLQHVSPRSSSDVSPMTRSQRVTYHQRREAHIIDACGRHGLMIAPGSVYAPEEFGWFRVTFSLGKDALQEGLKRLSAAIAEVEIVVSKASTGVIMHQEDSAYGRK